MNTVNFLVYQNLNRLGSTYYTESQGDLSGEYVPLADYQAQQVEIAKLRSLLNDWFELGPEFDILPSQNRDDILVRFEQLDKRTEEALGLKL